MDAAHGAAELLERGFVGARVPVEGWERTIYDKGRQHGASRLVDMDDARHKAGVRGEPLDLECAAPVGGILALRGDLEHE
jgi:hypothetical protein